MAMVGVVALSEWLSQTRSSLEGLASPEGVPGEAFSQAHVHLLLLLVLVVILFPLLLNISTWVLWIFVSIVVGMYVFGGFVHVCRCDATRALTWVLTCHHPTQWSIFLHRLRAPARHLRRLVPLSHEDLPQHLPLHPQVN